METDWPTFKRQLEGEVLSGIYGTRFVEHLILGRFDDEFDRSTDVFKARLQEARMQLWTQPESTQRCREAFAAHKTELPKWAAVVKAADLKPE